MSAFLGHAELSFDLKAYIGVPSVVTNVTVFS